MLRILHTADWHLGQTLRGYSRWYEQEQVLDRLIQLVEEREIDTLLIAGDVFDSQHPSGEAQSLFYKTLARLHQVRPSLNTVVVAGNHDAAGRLEAPHPLLAAFNVHAVGNVRRAQDRMDCERHLLTLRDAQGEAYLHVVAVSYPTAACLPSLSRLELEGEETSVVRAVRELYEVLSEALTPRLAGLPFITTGHLHVRGGAESEGAERRILVGGQHAVPHDVFPIESAYVALGHLHKAQAVGKETIRYSGSLIPLSATEQPYRHGFTLITINEGLVASEHLEIPRPVPFLRLPIAGGEVRMSELADHLRTLGLAPDLPIHLRPFVQVRLSRQGLGAGFREQVERIAADYAIRIVEARPDPLLEVMAGLTAALEPQRGLGQREPEEMFLLAFERATGAAATTAHLEIFHRAYSEAQE
ncbi:metallophosphoesterase family protein [Edaphobacter aggregans]|uniref:metallophosphoesterase family protein n=1 Tax=Edaphobacter aggregans TaxID=570835 RepID=UPI00054DA8C2|nr:exonuclease subunit SbcD [Edaphobacter aggregans]